MTAKQTPPMVDLANPAAMTERLIDAAIYNEQASGGYVAGARKELNDARAEIEKALSRLSQGGGVVDIADVRSQAEMLLLAIKEHDPTSELEVRVNDILAALAPSPSAGKDEARSDAWSDFESEFLTDGNGHAPVKTYQACRSALIAEWPNGRDKALEAAKAVFDRLHPASPPATPVQPTASVEAVKPTVEQIARAICRGRDLNPDCQNQGAARDGSVDGNWPEPRENFGRPYDTRWHYGWRNQAKAAQAVLDLLASLAPAPTQGEPAGWVTRAEAGSDWYITEDPAWYRERGWETVAFYAPGQPTPSPAPVSAPPPAGEREAELERMVADLRQQIARLTGNPALTDDEIRASTERATRAGEAQNSPEYWRAIYPDGNYPEGV